MQALAVRDCIWWVFLCDKTPPNRSTDPGHLPYIPISGLLLLGSLRMSSSFLFIPSLIHLESPNQIPRSPPTLFILPLIHLEGLNKMLHNDLENFVLADRFCTLSDRTSSTIIYKSLWHPQTWSPKGWNSPMFLEQLLTTGHQSNKGWDDERTESACRSLGRNSGDVSH